MCCSCTVGSSALTAPPRYFSPLLSAGLSSIIRLSPFGSFFFWLLLFNNNIKTGAQTLIEIDSSR